MRRIGAFSRWTEYSVKFLGRQLVYNYELPGHRRQIVYINLFIYDKDGRQFVYFGRQLVCTANDTASNPTIYTDNVIPNVDKNNYTQPTSNNGINNTDNSLNFASIAAKEITPNREQAIVFNSIDGVPQKDYVIAIAKSSSTKTYYSYPESQTTNLIYFLTAKKYLNRSSPKIQQSL